MIWTIAVLGLEAPDGSWCRPVGCPSASNPVVDPPGCPGSAWTSASRMSANAVFAMLRGLWSRKSSPDESCRRRTGQGSRWPQRRRAWMVWCSCEPPCEVMRAIRSPPRRDVRQKADKAATASTSSSGGSATAGRICSYREPVNGPVGRINEIRLPGQVDQDSGDAARRRSDVRSPVGLGQPQSHPDPVGRESEPTTALNTVVAVVVLGYAGSARALTLLALVQVVDTAVLMPNTPDHQLLAALVNLADLVGLVRPRPRSSAALVDAVAPTARWVLLIAYSAAVIAKYNYDFLDAAHSCAAVVGTHHQLRCNLDGQPSGRGVRDGDHRRETPVVTLLIVRRTRAWGVVFGVAFRLLVSLSPAISVGDSKARTVGLVPVVSVASQPGGPGRAREHLESPEARRGVASCGPRGAWWWEPRPWLCCWSPCLTSPASSQYGCPSRCSDPGLRSTSHSR